MMMSLITGEFATYELREIIGEGMFGRVFKGRVILDPEEDKEEEKVFVETPDKMNSAPLSSDQHKR
jgi:hypothetical protein